MFTWTGILPLLGVVAGGGLGYLISRSLQKARTEEAKSRIKKVIGICNAVVLALVVLMALWFILILRSNVEL